MRSWLLSVLGVLCAFFLQVSVGRHITIAGVAPDLVLIAVVLAGLSRGPTVGGVIGFLGGFYEDLYLPTQMGAGSLANTAVGFLAGEAGERLRREQPATQAAIFLVLTGVRELIRNTLVMGPRVLQLLGPTLVHDLLLVIFTTAVGVGMGVLGRNVLFGERRFAESVTARRRVR
jgi:rod shape-determining protein MreD